MLFTSLSPHAGKVLLNADLGDAGVLERRTCSCALGQLGLDLLVRHVRSTAKLAGAPASPAAGIEFLAPLGRRVERGEPLFRICATARGELDYAVNYLVQQPDIVRIAETT